MQEISIKKVSSKTYNKTKKRMHSGVTIKKKQNIKNIKNTIYYLCLSVLFYFIIFFICTALMKIKSLWLQTLIKPPFILNTNIFLIINFVIYAMMMYILFYSFKIKDKALSVSLIINGIFNIPIYYMFYGLKSSLGSMVILAVLIIQTFTILSNCFKNKKLYSLILLILLLWQIYNVLVIYTILMLN